MGEASVAVGENKNGPAVLAVRGSYPATSPAAHSKHLDENVPERNVRGRHFVVIGLFIITHTVVNIDI